MKQIIYIIILSVLTLFGCGHEKKYPYKKSDFRHELKERLDRIGSVHPDTLTANYLRDSCSKEELLRLMICEKPYIRIVAYKAIVNRNEPDLFSILLNHLDDTTKVEWWPCEDVQDYSMVSDLMILNVINNQKLNRFQKDILIDSVLFKHIYLETAIQMINDIQPKEKYYSIIKLLAHKHVNCLDVFSCHDLRYTYALAKFKKQEDIQFINMNFSEFTDNENCNDYYFKAIEAFPDSVFFPLLEKYFNEVIKKKKQRSYKSLKLFCQAVAQYRDKKSLDILIALAKKETYPDTWYFSSNQEYIFRAIHKYPSPIFDSLYNTLKSRMSEYIMDNIDNFDNYDDETIW